MNQLLIQYSYLQVLDLMTTLAFLLHGIQEGNPLVRFAMKFTASPIGGLVLIKCLALALGIYCWQCGRQRLLPVQLMHLRNQAVARAGAPFAEQIHIRWNWLLKMQQLVSRTQQDCDSCC